MAGEPLEGPVLLEQAPPHGVPAPAARSERLALRLLQLGAVAVVLAATTWKQFELDRFFVPKELVLHVTALLVGVLLLGAFRRRIRLGAVDFLLLGFLLLGLVSGGFAQNPWVAARALAVTASGFALYWSARTLAAAGLERPLLAALALAVVLASGTALLQAYGVQADLFSINRAPGGTFGNRNFIAHAAAFGLPVVLLGALRARGAAACAFWSIGSGVVGVSLVLTRSRAGWLAVGAALAVLGLALFLAPALRHHRRTWLRVGGILVVLSAGVAAALTVPNTLRWNSRNPYLDTVRGVTNFQEGSGRGRMVQYRRSASIARDHPLLGAGPGNWAVVYADYAAPGDPSLDRSAAGMTSNPWPSSDWVAYVSERGIVATLALLVALLLVAVAALRRTLRAADPHDALAAAAQLATLAAAVVAGLFDAVLLLAVPAFLVWTTIGALHASPTPTGPDARPRTGKSLALLVVSVLALAGAVRSAGQLAAMPLYASERNTLLRLAAWVDPGNYRVHLRLARNGRGEQRCRHALAARELYPNAQAARQLARRCD